MLNTFPTYLANIAPLYGLWLGSSGHPDEIQTNMYDIFYSGYLERYRPLKCKDYNILCILYSPLIDLGVIGELDM